uniref:Uncharacterized protein n=1 Tax=Anguilla anguilla TaxID=7936 RepID=A0A0E9WQ48_ANGAN
MKCTTVNYCKIVKLNGLFSSQASVFVLTRTLPLDSGFFCFFSVVQIYQLITANLV